MEELSAGATPAPYINPMRAKELVRQQQPYEGQMGQLRTPCALPMDSLTQGYHRKKCTCSFLTWPISEKPASRVHHTRVQLHLAAFTPRRTDVGVSSTKHSVACAAVKGAMMATERQHKALTRAESCARHQHLNVHAPFCVVRARISKRIARRQESTRDGTRTRNLLLRREAPYPLGHTSCCEQ